MGAIVVTWDQLAALLAIAAGVGLAGHLSGALWYTRRQRVRFQKDVELKFASAETKIAELSAKVEALPEAPDPEEFADGMANRLRAEFVNIAEQGASKQIEPLVARMKEVLQAGEASRQASFDAYLNRVTLQAGQLQMGQVDPMVARIVSLLRAFHKKREAEAVLALAGFMGQQRPSQPQFAPGTLMNPGGPPANGGAGGPVSLPPMSGSIPVTPEMIHRGPPSSPPAPSPEPEDPEDDGTPA